jgi:microcystin-dependent protein
MAAAPAIELEVDYLVYKDSGGTEIVQSVKEMAAPTGGIQAFAMPTAPDGWLICDGSNNLLISDFPALYEVLSVDLDCTVGNGSTVVTVNDSIGTTNLSIGMGVRGVGIPPNAEIVQINTATTFTMNTIANANNTAPVKLMYWGQGTNISTFKIPDLKGSFLRGTGTGQINSRNKGGGKIGTSVEDQMQKLTGSTYLGAGNSGARLWANNWSGALQGSRQYNNLLIQSVGMGGSAYNSHTISFDSSTSPSARTSSATDGETYPYHAHILYCIKF